MKCISCGGTLRYDIASYGLVCDFCGTVRRLHRPEEGAAIGEFDFATALRGSNTNWGVTRRLVNCKSCGAQLHSDPEQMSGMCPYCGSAVVLSAEDADCGVAPSAIIPFTLTKEQVAEKFYRWNKFAFWSPEKFRRGKLLSDLVPLYVPYWTFEADAVTTYAGRFGHTTGSGDNEKTTWYIKTGIAEKHISEFNVCGSRKFFNDNMLNSVVSFKSRECLPYTPETLSGMAAEIYTIGIDEAWNYAKTVGLKKEIMESARENENVDCYRDLQYSTEFYNVKFKYVLVPVYLAGCRYGGKIYNVVASGTNGRGKCNRPISIAKFIITPLLFLAYFTIGSILNLGFWYFQIGILIPFAALAVFVIMFMVAFGKQREQEAREREQYYSEK
jgi:DNA-directed RNA polymerase subunit RPC12/RpoP